MPAPTNADRWTWRPLLWAIAVGALSVTAARFSTFWSDLTFLSVIGFMLWIGTVVGVGVMMLIALVRWRPRRLVLLGCALAALPLVWAVGLQLTICDPYFWHVLFNQARFEERARWRAEPGKPILVIVDERDVVGGFFTDPPIVKFIIFDERHVLANPPPPNSPDWPVIGGYHFVSDGTRRAQHLLGPFYLLTVVF